MRNTRRIFEEREHEMRIHRVRKKIYLLKQYSKSSKNSFGCFFDESAGGDTFLTGKAAGYFSTFCVGYRNEHVH